MGTPYSFVSNTPLYNERDFSCPTTKHTLQISFFFSHTIYSEYYIPFLIGIILWFDLFGFVPFE